MLRLVLVLLLLGQVLPGARQLLVNATAAAALATDLIVVFGTPLERRPRVGAVELEGGARFLGCRPAGRRGAVGASVPGPRGLSRLALAARAVAEGVGAGAQRLQVLADEGGAGRGGRLEVGEQGGLAVAALGTQRLLVGLGRGRSVSGCCAEGARLKEEGTCRGRRTRAAVGFLNVGTCPPCQLL